MANFCTKCGRPISECTCAATAAPAPKKQNFMTIRDFFGVRESDNHLSTADCFERNKQIAPDLIDLAEGEYPIKQYEIGRVRSRSTLSWGYSRIQLTNKRLIQRTVGRSAIGKDIGYREYAIDDIIGVNYTRGKQFSFNDFLIILFISILTTALGALIGLLGIVIPILVSVLAIGFLIFMLFIQKQSNNFLCAIVSSFTLGTWGGTVAKNVRDFNFSEELYATCAVFAIIFLLCSLFFAIRFALLPSISLVVRTKSFQTAAAAVVTRRILPVTIPETVLPGKDTENAIREIGAIITDIQNIGDGAVEKWKSRRAPRQAPPAPQFAAPAPQHTPVAQRPVQQDVPMQRPVRQAPPAQRPAQPVQRPVQPAQRPAAPAQPMQRPVQPPVQQKAEKKYDFDLDFDFDIDNL